MTRIRNAVVIFTLLILGYGCVPPTAITPTVITPAITLTGTVPTSTPIIVPPVITGAVYYLASTGDDSNPGTLVKPWQTMDKAMDTLQAGDVLYVRGGQYDGVVTGWNFKNSGTQAEPITVTNYPGEQVVFKITTVAYDDRYIFRCWINPRGAESAQTTKADYIRIVGSDVAPRLLTNHVESQKGIVMQGLVGEQAPAIIASDCDHWEVAGVDFVDVAYGIFTKKHNWATMEEHSTDYWHVHDNRVYGYYRESGMQFNGNFNLIENNEIYKVSDQLDTPHGCQLLNLLGSNNVVRGNTLSRLGSTADCIGILFEWDLADRNLIESNIISDVSTGIGIQGGDGNIIKSNRITATVNDGGVGIRVASYDGRMTWPCNEPEVILPANDKSHSEYDYYYPNDCHSKNNRIQENTISGFKRAWDMSPVADESNVFLDNVIAYLDYIPILFLTALLSCWAFWI